MNWEDEPYVRLYQRDTLTWKIWPWQSRAIFPSIIRKLDRAGVMDIGDTDPFEAIAVMIDFPLDVVRIGLDPIFQKGTLRISKGQLVAPNYIEAQEARASDRARQRLSRERRRDKANVTDRDKQSHKTVTKRDDRQKQCDNRSQNVTEAKVTKRDEVITKRDTTSQNVRNCHNSSHAVTPSPPSLTPSEFQDQRECSPGARAREDNPSTNHTHTHNSEVVFLWPETGRIFGRTRARYGKGDFEPAGHKQSEKLTSVTRWAFRVAETSPFSWQELVELSTAGFVLKADEKTKAAKYNPAYWWNDPGAHLEAGIEELKEWHAAQQRKGIDDARRELDRAKESGDQAAITNADTKLRKAYFDYNTRKNQTESSEVGL